MRPRRDILMIGVLFLALILFVAIAPQLFQPPNTPDMPTSHSSSDSGAMALYTWLRSLGYNTRRLEYRAFELDEDAAALVILRPIERINKPETVQILNWVEAGGTLIFADDSSITFGPSHALLDELEVQVAVYSDTLMIEQASAAQPVLDQPPTGPVQVNTGYILDPQHHDYASLLHADGADLLIGIKRGQGYIYLSSTTYPFTNAGLREPGSGELALNLLRRVPVGGQVLFDEYHHGYVTPPSAAHSAISSPWGLAALYATIVITLYLILSGRRFGRSVPLQAEIARRSSAEYVESMADLLQRGGKRAYIGQHYHTTLKRRLARPAGINPQLDDESFTYELARFRPIDQQALLGLLARLRNPRSDEAELVRAVTEAELFLNGTPQ